MYAPNGSIPEISIDERCKLYCKVNIKDQNTSAVDSQNELKTSVQGNKNAHPNTEREREGGGPFYIFSYTRYANRKLEIGSLEHKIRTYP
jgi:hypothetical protein